MVAVAHCHGIRLGIGGSGVRTPAPAAPGNLRSRVAKKITSDSQPKQRAFNKEKICKAYFKKECSRSLTEAKTQSIPQYFTNQHLK